MAAATADGLDEEELEAGFDELHPPLNFALVMPGVYRSGFPVRRNFTFLARLQLRLVVAMVLLVDASMSSSSLCLSFELSSIITVPIVP